MDGSHLLIERTTEHSAPTAQDVFRQRSKSAAGAAFVQHFLIFQPCGINVWLPRRSGLNIGRAPLFAQAAADTPTPVDFRIEEPVFVRFHGDAFLGTQLLTGTATGTMFRIYPYHTRLSFFKPDQIDLIPSRKIIHATLRLTASQTAFVIQLQNK